MSNKQMCQHVYSSPLLFTVFLVCRVLFLILFAVNFDVTALSCCCFLFALKSVCLGKGQQLFLCVLFVCVSLCRRQRGSSTLTSMWSTSGASDWRRWTRATTTSTIRFDQNLMSACLNSNKNNHFSLSFSLFLCLFVSCVSVSLFAFIETLTE